jgi:hypothetical protein
MIYRGPGFLAIVLFGYSPAHPPASSVSKQALPATHRKTEKQRQLADVRGGGGGGRAKSYDSEKAWSSINHSTLYGLGSCLKINEAGRDLPPISVYPKNRKSAKDIQENAAQNNTKPSSSTFKTV